MFAPSCISHTVLTKRDWQSIRIGDITLPQALRCWELQPYWSVSNHMAPGAADTSDDHDGDANLATVHHPIRHGHKRYKAANSVESK